MTRGIFIVLEGPDGSGTTKHTELLTERIRQEMALEVVQTAEPTSGAIGKMTRTLLHGNSMPQADSVQLLFCADRAEHVAAEILPALERGAVVVCDRYTLSTIVYGTAQGLDHAWLTAVNAHFPQPDITIVALPPFDVCMERTGRRAQRDQFEEESFQQRVYKEYASVPANERTFIVDTTHDKHDVAEEIWSQVSGLLKNN
jgi:dTMP kinase